MKMLKDKRGITLIALVITIIVLLILAGITINLTIGENGIISKAKEAGDKYAQATENEQSDLADFLQETESLINSNTGSWDKTGKVNAPSLLTGMTPIKFTEPTSSSEGTVVETTSSDASWYNYDAKNWANAKTQDGSMWVWIPRFAYKINSTTQTVDVVFLIGTTDNYYKADGTIETAQRATSTNTSPDTTADYTVHPAFTNESSINYANGGWDSELTGIWVAKFEAGYAGGNNTATAKNSSVAYTSPAAWVAAVDRGTTSAGVDIARNYYKSTGYTKVDENGTMTYGSDTTKYSWINGVEYIKYPVFQGLTYSMNYITSSDAYDISQALTESGNIYGLSSSNADSHLIKDSEWGAVAYLSQSQYGLNGENIAINNVTLNGSTSTIYAVTGCASTIEDASPVTTTIESLNANTTSNVATWTQSAGTKASSTGTIYGIYDLSGGLFESTSSYVANNNENLSYFGNSIITETNRKYVMIYTSAETNETTTKDEAAAANYNANNKIGDAIREVSTAHKATDTWGRDYTAFGGLYFPFWGRGGFWEHRDTAGVNSIYYGGGNGASTYGFRAVLVAK
jgi:hypothetical protein